MIAPALIATMIVFVVALAWQSLHIMLLKARLARVASKLDDLYFVRKVTRDASERNLECAKIADEKLKWAIIKIEENTND